MSEAVKDRRRVRDRDRAAPEPRRTRGDPAHHRPRLRRRGRVDGRGDGVRPGRAVEPRQVARRLREREQLRGAGRGRRPRNSNSHQQATIATGGFHRRRRGPRRSQRDALLPPPRRRSGPRLRHLPRRPARPWPRCSCQPRVSSCDLHEDEVCYNVLVRPARGRSAVADVPRATCTGTKSTVHECPRAPRGRVPCTSVLMLPARGLTLALRSSAPPPARTAAARGTSPPARAR